MTDVLEVNGLTKTFWPRGRIRRRSADAVPAVADVSFAVGAGCTFGLVGESGAGKSTVGRLVLRLIEPDGGSIRLHGVDFAAVKQRKLRHMRRDAQMIFQDPRHSLDPRMRIFEAVAEPLKVHLGMRGSTLEDRVVELLRYVGLQPGSGGRLPRELSGGQLQRICIARALAVEPQLIVCDEPTSSLDVSVQAQILNLLMDLQEENGLTYLFISHDLAVVRALTDSMAVMRHGRIVEAGRTEELFEAPREEYTRELIGAMVSVKRRQREGCSS